MITHTINGEFITTAIVTNLNQIDSLSFSKEFTTIMTRKIRFVKVGDSAGAGGYRWRIDALTPLTGGLGDKVSKASLILYSLTDSLELDELLYS